MADLMELHEENSFKVQSYANAYINLRKYPGILTESTENELLQFPGLGKSVVQKIIELRTTLKIKELEDLLARTPAGIVDILKVKGLGPKKVRALWQGLQIEDPATLYQACIENRLVTLKGFGIKTQDDIKEKLQFYFASQDKYHYATVHDLANELLEKLRVLHPELKIELTGDVRRKMPVVESISIISNGILQNTHEMFEKEEGSSRLFYHSVEVNIKHIESKQFIYHWVKDSSSEEFFSALNIVSGEFADETALFQSCDLPYIDPEYRESGKTIEKCKQGFYPKLINESDIKGLIHNHTTYSDGIHSLKEMAEEAKKRRYQYLVVSDHSVSAFYAGGLKEEEIFQQWKEIDELNSGYKDFRILKGIESDILNDGNLDYNHDILNGFEVVIASIHSNLKMDREKAMSRLIKAIENPRTHILGHPTGRLLLGRKGYEVDHKLLIDACAANHVAIEINANPLRMDLDWHYITYAIEKEVKISINPDAHNYQQYDYVKYGVYTARKGGLSPSDCLNTLTAEELLKWADIKR